MSRRLVLCAALLAIGAGPVRAETLYDVIALAYQTNPTLRAQRDALRSTDETYVQAKGGYGPQIAVTGQGGYLDAHIRQGSDNALGQINPTTYRSTTGQADFSVVQPLYTGGAVRAEVRSASAAVLAGREALRQAESQTLLNVVTAYVDVRRDRGTVRILTDEIAALTGIFAETRARGALGALTRTDVAEAQARLLSVQAQRQLAQVRLDASEAGYLAVVGHAAGGDLADEPELPGLATSLDGILAAAAHDNPQLLEAIDTELAAREKVNRAKAADAPNLALRFDAGIAPYLPFQDSVYAESATVVAVLTKPLFTAGINSSRIRQAQDEDDRAQLNVEAARRGVVQLATEAWTRLARTRDAMAVQQQQIDVQTVAVHGNRVEERVGLRTTIDVLNAELELADARINLLQSRRDAYVARATLLAAMGLLEVRYLLPDMQRYDPVDALKRVEGRGRVPWAGAIARIDAIAAPETPAPRLSPPDAGPVPAPAPVAFPPR